MMGGREVAGRDLTTIAIGGPCELFEPESIGDVEALLGRFRTEGRAYRVLGAGSNVLIPDEGCSAAIVRLGRFSKSVTWGSEGALMVGAGYSLMRLAREAADRALHGLEFAGGIPATIGGAIAMNAGAHGEEIRNIARELTILSPQEGVINVSAGSRAWSYRRGPLAPGEVLLAVDLQLTSGKGEAIKQCMSERLAYRKATQPLTVPSCGSVFKNPSPELPAGKILEECGVKGLRRGGAQFSELHANWIVNPERRASAADVLALIEEAQARAARRGVNLEPELQRW